eukprot:333249-Chlamydomonas_euryale.AAC.1
MHRHRQRVANVNAAGGRQARGRRGREGEVVDGRCIGGAGWPAGRVEGERPACMHVRVYVCRV